METQDLLIISLEKRLQRQEFRNRFSIILWLLSIFLLAVPAWIWTSTAQSSEQAKSLKVSELVVVDPKGVERVRISGDVPDAVINGKRINRGEKAAGVILYDSTGQERSGYVTFESGNIVLTLDTRKGQVGYFGAGPDEGSVMKLWHDKDTIEARSDSEGSRLTMVKNGIIISQQPEIKTMANVACKAYKDAGAQFTKEQLINECRKRYNRTACRACLGK